MSRISNIADEAVQDVDRASRLHEPMNSAHEAYAVIMEEVDEFWDEVCLKREERSHVRMRKELIQVAAMAIRTINDLDL